MIDNLRRCSKCKEYKPLANFGVKKQRKDGINLWCKACVNISIDARRSTPEGRKAHNEREKARGRADPIAACLRTRKWAAANPERHRATNQEGWSRRWVSPVFRIWERIRQAEWERSNPAKVVAKANRGRSAKLGATPKWLTSIQKAQIQQFYDIAVARETQTGIRYTVDHVHPLRGANFSGLHVPWNLQIMSHSANSSKANKVQPEHIDDFFEAA